ncbi:MAG: hypothetical protein LIO85_06725 [Rikenellaceae bacterium]|nr:hypothetical protein [Rikenellaceae bacterium]
MPRELNFRIKRKQYSAVPVKVDRKKLYGWTEILALDEQGRPCDLVTTDQTGTLIIPRGGTAMAILSPQGEWVERSTLRTVRDDGSEAELIPSSYSVVIDLKEKVSEEEFLNHSITDFYQITEAPEALLRAVGQDIYTFRYTYLDSYETTPAFLMSADGVLYMLIGYRNRFEMLCLGDCEAVDEQDDDYVDVEDNDIDFSMLF